MAEKTKIATQVNLSFRCCSFRLLAKDPLSLSSVITSSKSLALFKTNFFIKNC